jgi:hypothetical protein
MIPTIRHARKGKTVETGKKKSIVARYRCKGRDEQIGHRGFLGQ